MISGFGTPGGSTEAEETPFVPDLTHGFGAPAPTVPAAQPGEVASYLNASASFKGMLKSSRSVGIDGHFEGEIQSEGDIVVGREAEVKANIKAGNVIISGRVVGNIECSSLEIQSSGRVIGNITAQSLLIAMGAVFRGQSLMGSDQDAAAIPEPFAEPVSGRRGRSSEATE
ncbi:MAG: polymer-forming cytoskeletal protein [Chloroflexi bacterium]|nr:polymer-forming cytoskeletal protein [Chloroflexota bacterium]